MQYNLVTQTVMMVARMKPPKPVMKFPNNLFKLMERDSVTQADIARAWGVENGDVHQRVNGKVRVTPERAKVLKEKFGWTASEIYEAVNEVRKVLVLGYVGAGGEICPVDDLPLLNLTAFKESDLENLNCETVEAPPGVYPSEVACVKVRGHSMHPVYKDGEYLFYRRYVDLSNSFIDQDCIVSLEDGRMMVKTLKRSENYGKFNLDSYNEPTIKDVEIKWAAPVEWTKKNVRR